MNSAAIVDAAHMESWAASENEDNKTDWPHGRANAVSGLVSGWPASPRSSTPARR
jgi:hypothetical protein